jgi:TP901-1 family phage major tail protein
MFEDDFFFGDTRILYVKYAGQFLPVACLTNNSMQETAESLETTTRDNPGGWETSIPVKQSYSISFEGLQINSYFVAEVNKVSYDLLKALKRSRAIFEWELRTLDGVFVDFGQGYITDLSEEAPAEGFLTFSGTIKGVGETIFTSGDLENITFDNEIIDFSNTLITWDNEFDPQPPVNPLVENLVLFYKFNEAIGTTAIDDSSENNDGNIVNAVINQPGLIDRCYQFNKGPTNQYVEIPDSDSLSFGAGAFSIEVWINPSANFGRILNKYNATTGDLESRLFLQSGVLQFFIYTDASNRIGIADNVNLVTSSWNQIVITYDGSGVTTGLKMWVNNTVASFAPQQTGLYTGMPNTAQPVILAQQADDLTGSNRYSGLMDILRMWKGYVLTDANREFLNNSGNGTETL